MTTMLLAVLGWCLVSVTVTAVWAAVCVGSRRGAQRNVAAWQRPSVAPTVAVRVPSPRSAPAGAPVAV